MRYCVLYFLFSRDLKPENILLDDNGKNNNLLQAITGTSDTHAKHFRQSMMESLHAIFAIGLLFLALTLKLMTHIISSHLLSISRRVE